MEDCDQRFLFRKSACQISLLCTHLRISGTWFRMLSISNLGWSILSKFSFTHPNLGICVCRMQENWWWMITAVFLTVPDTWNINFFYELCSKQTILPLIGNSWISKSFHWNIKDFLSGSRFWVGIWNQSFMFHTFSKLFHFYFKKPARYFLNPIG